MGINVKQLLVIIGVLVISLSAFISVIWSDASRRNERALADLKWYKNQWQSKQGWTTLYNGKNLTYHLMSFDSGKNWYVIDSKLRIDSAQVKILGREDEIYPGLIKHLALLDTLVARAERNKINK